ncbi:MAG: L,D-transpeptidase family protein [bacterium]
MPLASRTVLLALAALMLLPGMGDTATIDERLEAYGDAARGRLAPWFHAAQSSVSPAEIALIGLKDAGELQLYARDRAEDPWVWIRTWPILASSGGSGPKLREGDRQVPEGRYRITMLNPNSHFHLSLRVDYPNTYDRARGKDDDRTALGGDIMIHGNQVTIGCIPIGDEAIEELFVLAADTGLDHIRVLLAPTDFRLHPAYAPPSDAPIWTADLYAGLRTTLAAFPLPPED